MSQAACSASSCTCLAAAMPRFRLVRTTAVHTCYKQPHTRPLICSICTNMFATIVLEFRLNSVCVSAGAVASAVSCIHSGSSSTGQLFFDPVHPGRRRLGKQGCHSSAQELPRDVHCAWIYGLSTQAQHPRILSCMLRCLHVDSTLRQVPKTCCELRYPTIVLYLSHPCMYRQLRCSKPCNCVWQRAVRIRPRCKSMWMGPTKATLWSEC